MSKILIDEATVKLALDALERYQVKRQDFDRFADEITALREALAEQPAQQEPVAWMQNTTAGLYVIDHYDEWHCIPLYTSPPAQRKPLTDDEIESINERLAGSRDLARLFARAIEAAHGIKENT